MDHLCYLCHVFLMLLRLFIAALWPTVGKGLTSLLLLVMFIVFFLTFPCGILGQAWYLIVSFPDLCRLSYFYWQYWSGTPENHKATRRAFNIWPSLARQRNAI